MNRLVTTITKAPAAETDVSPRCAISPGGSGQAVSRWQLITLYFPGVGEGRCVFAGTDTSPRYRTASLTHQASATTTTRGLGLENALFTIAEFHILIKSHVPEMLALLRVLRLPLGGASETGLGSFAFLEEGGQAPILGLVTVEAKKQ